MHSTSAQFKCVSNLNGRGWQLGQGESTWDVFSQKTAFFTSMRCLATLPPYDSRKGQPEGEAAYNKGDVHGER
jgi:hypothetical protein